MFMRKNASRGRSLRDRLNVILVELPKFRDELGAPLPSPETLTSRERWAKFFLYEGDENKAGYVQKLVNSETGIMRAKKVLSRLSITDLIWFKINAYYDAKSDWITAADFGISPDSLR